MGSEVAKAFVARLVEAGYPEESIAYEYRVEQYFVDIAVINPLTQELVQIFEFKEGDSANEQMNAKAMAWFKTMLSKVDVPMYLVFGKKSNESFKFSYFSYSKNEISKVDNLEPLVLDFKRQSAARVSEKKADNVRKRNGTLSSFHWVSWTIALSTLLLLIAKKIFAIPVDAADIALYGVFIALAIIPFVNKLKILGVEIEKGEASKNPKDRGELP